MSSLIILAAPSMDALDGADSAEFRPGQRVHWVGNPRRIGTVRYVGPLEGFSGTWVGVDWDNEEAKHDGSINGVRYFSAKSEKSGSFVRPQNLSSGISLLDALMLRYRANSAKEDEDEMYVLSASKRRVSVQFVGKEKIQEKLSHFQELIGASLPYLGVSSSGGSSSISDLVPNLKEIDLTGNLLSEWMDIFVICMALPALSAINLSYNSLAHNISDLPPLHSIRVLVLNNTGVNWSQVDILKCSLPMVEELHLMGNKISKITTTSSETVSGFDSLKLINLGDNCIAVWDEILKLYKLQSLERLHLNKNCLNCIHYPGNETLNESPETCIRPFQNLRCLLLANNNIDDLASIDSLNYFPKLIDVRLSENPVADPGKSGVARFVLIARLAKIEILNGSEVSSRERKDSEIRYVRLIMSSHHGCSQDTIKQLHPRFTELKNFHGIEDETATNGAAGPQKMSSGLVSVNLECVGASIGERPLLTKKLPSTTTIGKLKILCESFFKLGSIKPKLYLQQEGSPIPVVLNDDLASLLDLGIGNESSILVDEVS